MKSELYNKALKGYYKLRSDFLSLNPSIKSSLHIFDHTIAPILLYNSEIWGCYCASNSKLRISFDLDKIYNNSLFEKLHLKFSKFILGVHKKSVNFAVLSELGRFPLYYGVIKSIIRYWYRLENLSSDFPLLNDAYKCSKNLDIENKFSWFTFVNKLLQSIGIKREDCTKNKFGFNSLLDKLIRKKLLDTWYDQRNENIDGKLCTYLKIKDHFGFENYLTCMKNPDQRKALCRLRISAHRLQIETGRYSKTPRSERFCKKCCTNEIEDETHFLCECQKLETHRNKLWSVVKQKCPNFVNLPKESKIIFLLNNENTEVLAATAKFIIDNLD